MLRACTVEAVDRFGRARLRVELGRAHLVYGEWLRRWRRRRDARDQLGRACEIFDLICAAAFAERARIELRASGGQVREPAAEMPDTLTAQEALIARLAAGGASNPDIAAQLFISRATVAYHLRKVFTKLDIGSRTELPAPFQPGKAPHRRPPRCADRRQARAPRCQRGRLPGRYPSPGHDYPPGGCAPVRSGHSVDAADQTST
jgi:DNA-binding CsgD family transcriptional regulator